MRYLTIAILLTACVLLYTENQLEVVWLQQGECPSDDFGYCVISLDFNGDGIDDLATNAYRYYIDENHTNQKGKLYIYFGSDDGLSDFPNLTISTPVDTVECSILSWASLANLGDMNDDNCDEIGYHYRRTIYDGNYHYYRYVKILLGNTINDTIPDYSYLVTSSMPEIHPLGDINGDGYDDAGITEGPNDSLTYSIVYGGSFEKVAFVDGICTNGNRGFWGLGDVNGDGLGDFTYHIQGNTTDGIYHYYNLFFYGNTVQDTIPDYQYNYDTTISNHYKFVPAGDWNGDGYDDFCFSGYDATDDGSTSPGCRLWRGGETIHWDWYGHVMYYGHFYPTYGDINGDGKGDLIKPLIITSGDAGYLYFYLGDQNGTWDYHGYCGEEGYGSSNSHAVGDFDNDGFDDIAVGAYGNGGNANSNWGYVFVYGGHEDLEEVDLDDTSDESVPPADVTFNAYPNPFNPEISFEIKTEKSYNDLKIEIYNAKGQKIETIPIRTTQETIIWNAGNHASGVYFCKLNARDKILQTRKITLLK